MPASPLKLLILGAHPDDADYSGGALAAAWRRAGHTVRMVSATDGSAGHQEISGEGLKKIRIAEAAAAGRVIGAEYHVWDFRDGHLEPSLELRGRIIAEIRSFAPDLVLTHRPNDYHPDHRALGQAVQDASYLVTVPALVPQVPALRRDPVVAYLPDLFTRPAPLRADIVVDVTPHLETVIDMLACHVSQFFQWLPYNEGILDQVPTDATARRQWLKSWYLAKFAPYMQRYRREFEMFFGAGRWAGVRLAVPLEVSEYAGAWDDAARQRLTGFLP